MTTASEIIKQALRESNLIARNQTPTTAELDEELVRLNRLVESVYGWEVGERLSDWSVQGGPTDGVTSFWTAVEWTKLLSNVRVLAKLTSVDTLFLPAEPDDGARVMVVDLSGNFATFNLTLDPNGRKIEGSTSNLALVDNGLNRTWMYRAELSDWVRLTDMQIDLTAGPPVVDTVFPFPTKFDDAFITMLAVRINPQYGQGLQAPTLLTLERAREQIQAQYRQRVITRADLGVLRMSVQGQFGNRGID